MDSDDLKRKLGIDDDETYRVNSVTGIVEKQGIFGWSATDTKVEPESGDVQKRGIFGWNDTDTRVNPESGVVQERGIFGHNDTDTRVNPETGIVQERGVLGWNDTDERIDPKTGKHQERGIFGWKNSRSTSRPPSASPDDENPSSEGGLVKLVLGLAAVVFVIWFITSVAIPLVVINMASIALLGGAIKKSWSKVLFPVSIMGAIIVVADYNYGWATDVLVSNVAFFRSWIKPLLYANLLAGLIAAYLSIRHVLNTRTPPPVGAGELSKRNLIAIGCLLVVGAATIGVQQYVDTREQQAREQQAREQQAREQQAREQQAREQQAREQQAREQQAREQQAQEQQAREQQAREQQAREQQAREQQAREQQVREQQVREQQVRKQQVRKQQEAQQRPQEEAQLSSKLQNCVNAPVFKNIWVQYTQLPGVKALAIVVTSNGRCSGGSAYGGAPGVLQSEANNRAISSCRNNSARLGLYGSCRVYAEGHNIVWR